MQTNSSYKKIKMLVDFFVESRLYYETIPNVFSYPSALAKFDVVPQLFSVLFFLMLVTLGLGSATGREMGYCPVLPRAGLCYRYRSLLLSC